MLPCNNTQPQSQKDNIGKEIFLGGTEGFREYI